MTPQVAQAFDAFPDAARTGVMVLRGLILEVAAAEPEIGPVSEELRWGQPAYLVPKGTTLRLGVPKDGGFAIYAHCQTTVISDYAAAFPGMDRIEGNRAVRFERADQIDAARMRLLIHAALTYHEK